MSDYVTVTKSGRQLVVTQPAPPTPVTVVKQESVVTPVINETRLIETVSRVGPRGAPGSQILKGSGPPSNSLGANGDYYIDIADDDTPLYGPKVDNEWTDEVVSLSVNSRFVFDQAAPASTWVINHNLGGFPSISVVDSANTVVFGMVTYVNNTQVVLTFSAPFSGKAYLT
jgi:hypothetical protein